MCKVLIKKIDTNIEFYMNADYAIKFEDTTDCICSLSQNYAHDFSVDYAEKGNPILKINSITARQGDYVLIHGDREFARVFPQETYVVEAVEPVT